MRKIGPIYRFLWATMRTWAYLARRPMARVAEREQPCKHVYAVRAFIERESNPEAFEPVTLPDAENAPETLAIGKRLVASRPTYKQVWPAYNAAQIHEKAKCQ